MSYQSIIYYNTPSLTHISNSAYMLQYDDSSEENIEYDVIIKAFRHCLFGSTMICAVYGMKGHPAIKYYHRGFALSPRNLQHRILAY